MWGRGPALYKQNYYLSGSRRRLFAKSGGPFVSMECFTPWRGRGVSAPSPTIPGNSARRERTGGGTAESSVIKPVSGPLLDGPSGESVAASSTRLPAVSTKSLWLEKKSAPKIGLLTAASTKGTSVKRRPPKHTDFSIFPQDLIPVPSAPARRGASEAAGRVPLYGITLRAAPVSTRNRVCESESVR
jgi:hypothetical protein